MKMRFALCLVGLAIGFTVPTFAQQTVDPKVEQQIRALEIKYDEAFNRSDSGALADLMFLRSEMAKVASPLRYYWSSGDNHLIHREETMHANERTN